MGLASKLCLGVIRRRFSVGGGLLRCWWSIRGRFWRKLVGGVIRLQVEITDTVKRISNKIYTWPGFTKKLSTNSSKLYPPSKTNP